MMGNCLKQELQLVHGKKPKNNKTNQTNKQPPPKKPHQPSKQKNPKGKLNMNF